jgi:hypothetical protein
MRPQAFDEWLHNHPYDKNTLWAIQNCLGTLFGFEHPMAEAAKKAWEKAREEKCCANWCCPCDKEHELSGPNCKCHKPKSCILQTARSTEMTSVELNEPKDTLTPECEHRWNVGGMFIWCAKCLKRDKNAEKKHLKCNVCNDYIADCKCEPQTDGECEHEYVIDRGNFVCSKCKAHPYYTKEEIDEKDKRFHDYVSRQRQRWEALFDVLDSMHSHCLDKKGKWHRETFDKLKALRELL